MRTLALLPSTTLSQVMSPTTTTSRRLLNPTSRNPRSRMGPRMTSSTMTSPSARRSLMRAVDEPITLEKKVCRPVCRRPSVMIERGDPLWNRLTHKFQVFEKFRATAQRILLERQKEQILADCQAEIRKHDFQADYDRTSIQKLNQMIESQKEEICRAHQEENKIVIFLKLMRKASVRWKNWSDFKAQQSTQLRRENWSKIDILSLNSQARYIWFEIFSRCWISSQWTIPRCQSTSVFPTSPRSWWNAKPFSGNAEPQKRAAKHLGHT